MTAMAAMATEAPRQIGGLDLDTQSVTLEDGTRVHLTAFETRLLEILAARAGRVVSYDSIIQAIYGADPNGGPDDPWRTFAVHVCRIRKKLERSNIEIRTFVRSGYALIVKGGATPTCPQCGRALVH